MLMNTELSASLIQFHIIITKMKNLVIKSLENKHFAWDKTYSLKKLANSSDLLFQQ